MLSGFEAHTVRLAMAQAGEDPHPEVELDAKDELGRERDVRARRLAQSATDGSMTLEEYAARAASMQRAATMKELDVAVAGLPQALAEVPAPHRSWVFGVLGGIDQRGRWRLSRRLHVVCVFGGAHLDLGAAAPEAPECTITILALLGGAEITAPPGVPVLLSGLALMGGRSDERPQAAALPGAPLIRVRSFAFLGGVKVK